MSPGFCGAGRFRIVGEPPVIGLTWCSFDVDVLTREVLSMPTVLRRLQDAFEAMSVEAD